MTDLAPDYARIERALEWLDAHAEQQPSLDDAARVAGLSPTHFQRRFTALVGISPKRYVQAVTADRARTLLTQSAPVLAAALDVGLSGPSRLHDLLVATEGATPGDIARGGEGLEIRYAFHPTPFGEAFVAVSPRGVCALTFSPTSDRAARLERLRRDWPRARHVEDARAGRDVVAQVQRLAAAAETHAEVPASPLTLVVRGTNLQVRVWEALRRIPAGTLATYEDIARAVGAPTAVRAVAGAIGRNPIHLLIPCHRVVRKTGHLGGYAGGLPRKRAMLACELGAAVEPTAAATAVPVRRDAVWSASRPAGR
jgi:AraC family transcriptional regulator of adaptative response/methylated-DNA-[protein]-cysteine methyltransferase